MKRLLPKLGNTLQNRLVVATTVPLLVLTVVLTSVTMLERDKAITERLQQSGRSIALYLASVSDFALYSANKPLLNSLLTATDRLDGVSGVTFLNASREVVISTLPADHDPGKTSEPSGQAAERSAPANLSTPDKYLYFEEPVLALDLYIEDYGSAAVEDDSQLVGWVIVAIDPAVSQSERRAMLINGVGLAAGVMVMAIIMSYLLGRNIIGPIKKLTNTVNRIEGGDFSVRAESAPSYEFNVLAHGINHMAESIEENQVRLQQEVEGATHQLEVTLADLQSKNDELEIARQHADEANAAKTDFLARMSHELRTPLTSVRGFIGLLQSADLGSSEQQYCKIIDQAAQLLLQLIDDILEFSRLQAGAVELEELPIDFYRCLEDPIQLLAPMAHDKNLELILDIEPDVPLALVANSRRLRQIIFNLVSNSIKFTESGWVLVRVFLLADEADHCRVGITIKDTGIGISEEQKKHIFEAFTQADISISRRFGGTGLGLSIVNGLVDMMGGSISVDSPEGKGSTFKVVLPLKKQQALFSDQHLSSGLQPRGKQALNIALYDPDQASRQALEHLLTRITNSVESYGDIGALKSGLKTTQASVILLNGASVTLANPRAYPLLLEYIRQCTDLPLVITLPLKQLQKSSSIANDPSLQPASFIGKPVSIDSLKALFIDADKVVDSGTVANLSGVNVLVAEDNDFSQLLIKTMLDRAGCRYCLVGNGREAVEMSTREQFDVLLVDGHMPELDGWEALREIRALTNPNHGTPAIFLTADVLAQGASLPAGVGINRVMHKPFEEADLINAISKLAGKELSGKAKTSAIWQRIPKEKFFSEVESLLDKADQENQRGNTAELGEIVHQLLGIVGVFKVNMLHQLSEALHLAAKAGDHSQVNIAIADLSIRLAELKREVS
ncbi:MAG: response regulator [Porticoccaceae bacterium]|nr:response regulator [Porticoccaceae bacterium]